MQFDEVPVVGSLLTAGADDRVFDALLLLGPVVIVLIAALGRTPATVAVALAYTGGFAGYILYKYLR